jgi:hypothetical protein
VSGGLLGATFHLQDALAIAFDPSVPAGESSSGANSFSIPLVWARYTVRFANSSAEPESTGEVLPDGPAVATPRPRAQTQAITKSHAANLMQRRSRMPERDQINFSLWSTAAAAAESGSGSGSGDEAQVFILSDDFALRSKGSLLARSRRGS